MGRNKTDHRNIRTTVSGKADIETWTDLIEKHQSQAGALKELLAAYRLIFLQGMATYQPPEPYTTSKSEDAELVQVSSAFSEV